jgi:hypothetical protein
MKNLKDAMNPNVFHRTLLSFTKVPRTRPLKDAPVRLPNIGGSVIRCATMSLAATMS